MWWLLLRAEWPSALEEKFREYAAKEFGTSL
jgi:hypothetical protein